MIIKTVMLNSAETNANSQDSYTTDYNDLYLTAKFDLDSSWMNKYFHQGKEDY